MIVPEETLKEIGFKKESPKLGLLRNWTKRTVSELFDDIILEYNPSKENVRLIVQEPRMTHIDNDISIKDIDDFLDISWEFYVKYIAKMDYHHPEWDKMATLHKKPTIKEIEEKKAKQESENEAAVEAYKPYFENEEMFKKFAKEADVLRKRIEASPYKDDNDFIFQCITILGLSMSKGVNLYLQSENGGRSEFDINVLHYLLYEDKLSEGDIIAKIVCVKRVESSKIEEKDTDEDVYDKINLCGFGCSSMPWFLANFYWLSKSDNGKYKIEYEERKLIQCNPLSETTADGKYLRGYHYYISEWLTETYEKIKSKDNFYRFLSINTNHSVYEDYDFWLAGVKCGLFDKYEKR